MGVSRQMAQRCTVCVMYTDILYVVDFVTSLTAEFFSFLLLRLLTVNSNTLSVLHPGTVGTVPIFSAVSTF